MSSLSSSTKLANASLETLQSAITNHLLPGSKFAIIFCGNHQYKVSPGDVIAVQRLRAEIGSRIRLQKVLMVGGPRFTAVGRPLLEGVVVTADVEEQKRMRNVVSLFATPGRRRVRWVDAAHAATILRIRSITYQPQVLGELNKYGPKDSVSSSSALLQPPSSFDPLKPINPVFLRDDGYHIYQKKSTPAVESAPCAEVEVFGSAELMGMLNEDDANQAGEN